MKFAFPKDKKTESVNISVYKSDIDKIRKLAEINNCSQVDVYKTLVSEAIEDYEEKFGRLDGKPPKQQFSVKRDFVEAGDNRRKEVSGDEFDGGGDLRTKEAKAENAEPIEQKIPSADEEEQDDELVFHCEKCGVILDDNNFNEDKGFVDDSFFCSNCLKKKDKEKLKNPDAVALGKLGGKIGGDARAKVLSPERRKEISQKAANTRWGNEDKPEKLPKEWWKKENLTGGAQQTFNNAKQREEENLMNKVAYCSNHYCTNKPKFIRGMGIQYKGKEFCSDPCLEKFINNGQEKAITN